jgi:hypothetical protein
MSDATDIAEGFAEAFDAEREILGPSGSLKILSGPQHATTEATYTTGWKFPRKEYTELVTGKQFRLLKVADPSGSRRAKLIAGTALQIGSVVYKNAAKDANLNLPGVIPVYEFKIYGTGERV